MNISKLNEVMTAEERLIFQIISSTLGSFEDDLPIIDIVDQYKFVMLCKRYSLSSIIYKKYEQLTDIFDKQVIRQLEDEYNYIKRENSIRFNNLMLLTKALNNENIQTMVIKGTFLAYFVYKDIALRPMWDVDISIRKNDIHKFYRVLWDRGYRLLDCSEQQNYDLLKTHADRAINKNKRQIKHSIGNFSEVDRLDVHINYQKNISYTDDFWSRSIELNFMGQTIRALNIEDNIINLCLHLAYRHNFIMSRSILALYDIGAIIKDYSNDIDWKKICEISIEFKVEKYVYVTLFLVNWLTGVCIPTGVLSRLLPYNFDSTIIKLIFYRLLSQHRKRLHQSYDNIDVSYIDQVKLDGWLSEN